MKLIIQIPCLNEEKTIGDTIRSIPKHFSGISSVRVIVIDDGSTDSTRKIATEAGADRVISLPRHMGLAKTFSCGIETALAMDADILVNTDADLQYPSDYIGSLVKPIVEGNADIAIGDRLSYKPRPFGLIKMFFENLGSKTVSFFSGIQIKDAASGFRAFGREALEAMVIHGQFSYTLESLMLAGMKGFRVANITIPINAPTRKSRLIKNIPEYIARSSITILRAYLMYHPLKFFTGIGTIFITSAFIIGGRFLYYFFTGSGDGHIQSLILMSILALIGFQCVILGLVADVVAANRRLLENLRLKHLVNSAEQEKK